MLRQRILAAVIVRAGRAVQSFGYKRYLPLGDAACVVENLDQWGADGIIVLSIDRGLEGPDFQLLQKLSRLKLSTPLTYGGGIHNAAHARQAVQCGAERLVLDRALGTATEQLADMAAAVGRQALIASIPLLRNPDGVVEHWKYWQNDSQPLRDWLKKSQWQEQVSELLTIDVKSEGSQLGPDSSLWSELVNMKLPLLCLGGFSKSEQIETVLQQRGIAAAVIGNALNYQEQSIQQLKEQLMALPLRPHPMKSTHTST